jgi:flagellar basal-body rod protein FlgF
MNEILQITSVGMLEGNRRMEAIGQNATSASLPGYRSHVISGKTFAEAFSRLTPGDVADVRDVTPSVNLQRGAEIATGRPLDVAIEADDAYFALTDGTRTWLTRAGAFHVDASGRLIGEGGLRVMGVDGEINLPAANVTVETDGRLTLDGTIVATLQLQKPNASSRLVAAQGTLLMAQGGTQPAVGAGLRSGALEGSNTDSAHEMIDLMGVARQFEALSRLSQGYDEVLGKAIERLGAV